MNRPYSLSELAKIETDILAKHRLGDKTVTHFPCHHTYRVKKGGRKEQFISESGGEKLDDQTCSVCFKLRTSVVAVPAISFREQPDAILTRSYLTEMDSFYKWLYRHDFA